MCIRDSNDEKNATPGAPSRSPDKCLDDLRPVAVTMDRSNRSATDPAAQREGAFGKFGEGDLNIQTNAKFVDMWEGSYVSEAFPFALTRGVAGPDYRPDKGRGRRDQVKKAPILKATSYMKMLSRRSSAAVRSDWTLVPTIRSSTFKWQSEHIFAIAAPFAARRQGATDTSAKEVIDAMKNLYKHLQKGCVGSGVNRIPIKGDTTLLPRAKGLTPLERRLAVAHNFMAKEMSGTQQLRQLMGHTQFGARVVYGDCLFLTLSPNPQMSAMTLRLSRYRENVPYLQEGSAGTKALAKDDCPRLEGKTCGSGLHAVRPS